MIKKFLIIILGSENSEPFLRVLKQAKLDLLGYKIRLMRRLYPPNEKERCLNIGGGKWYYPRRENVDRDANEMFADYKIDLNLKIPVPRVNGCAKLIFCSHALEHLSDDICLFALKECYRFLKSGGMVRISVPDMDKAFEAYKVNDSHFFDEDGVRCVGGSIEEKLVNFFVSYEKDGYRGGPIVSPEAVKEKLKLLDKYKFVDWCVSLIPKDITRKEYMNGYDFAKLKSFLEKTGFSKVVKSEYRSFSVAILKRKAFDNRPMVSLFVEAFKKNGKERN